MSIRARTWTALAVPPFVWFLFEQGLSALLHTNCSRWPFGLAWGLLSLAVCGLTARLAWPLRHHQGALANPWLARLALALTGIFCLAIAFQTLAIAIVPACVG
jgi:hypothetical protein